MFRAPLLRTRMVQTSRCGNTHRKPSSSSYQETSQSSILVSSNTYMVMRMIYDEYTKDTLICPNTSLVHLKGLEMPIYLELIIMPLVVYAWSRQERWISPLWKEWDHQVIVQWTFSYVLVRPSSYSPKNAAKAESGLETCPFSKGHIENVFCCLTFNNFCLYGFFSPAVIFQAGNHDESGMDVHFAPLHFLQQHYTNTHLELYTAAWKLSLEHLSISHLTFQSHDTLHLF